MEFFDAEVVLRGTIEQLHLGDIALEEFYQSDIILSGCDYLGIKAILGHAEYQPIRLESAFQEM